MRRYCIWNRWFKMCIFDDFNYIFFQLKWNETSLKLNFNNWWEIMKVITRWASSSYHFYDLYLPQRRYDFMSHTVLCVPPKSNLASFKKASLVRKLDIQRQRRSFLSNALEARPPLAKKYNEGTAILYRTASQKRLHKNNNKTNTHQKKHLINYWKHTKFRKRRHTASL